MSELPSDTKLLDWLQEQTALNLSVGRLIVRVVWTEDDAIPWQAENDILDVCHSDIRQAIAAAMDKYRKDGEHET